MSEKGYRDRLDNVIIYNKEEDIVRSTIATGEDLHKLLQEVRKIQDKIGVRSAQEKESKRKLIDTALIDGVRFNVYEYDSSYLGDIRYATAVYHAQQLEMKLRSLEVDLHEGKVTVESGMFQSSEGKIELQQSFSPVHFLGGFVRKMNKETFFRPEFEGTGTVRLESNFKFIKLVKVPRNTRIVLEKGIYLASAGDWKHKTAKNFNLGTMFFSDKSILQTELYGNGLIALELPMHETELVQHVVTEDRPFKVNGDYVLYWVGNLRRKIHPSKKLLGNLASGRGVVEEYTGVGYVYTAPTLGMYNHIADDLKGSAVGRGYSPIGEGADIGKQRKTLKDLFNFRGTRG